MAFDDIEKSTQSGEPSELYTFAAPAWTYRLTSHVRDIVFGGFTYTATPQARSSLSVVDLHVDQSEVTITLPAKHALARAYAPGVPVRELLVTITRYHEASGVSLQMWQGYATGLSFQGRDAVFRVPSGTADQFQKSIPGVVARRLCNNMLYDSMCQQTKTAGNLLSAITIANISADGKTITLSSIGGKPDQWSRHGGIKHISTTEERTVVDQIGTAVGLMVPFPNGTIAIGDAVELYRGCDHQLTTCNANFGNALNFGGHAHMPPSNLFYVGLLNTRYH